MKLSSLLCRFAWYRRWRGGTWRWGDGRWVRVEIEVIEPFTFFDDDFTCREDLRQFLAECEKQGQRDRT